ncbi:methylated-DNA--[protein]-cysteine S-methyltransferase [Vagococcus zengguangii]|uniref:methylated-DNA--[protein]-cysteine S-methyltransferase n=1 Tax=Vagococcus zengguangii TaxID=2571750 RepID=A0A4D7CZV5_9ENTE|nr:methylated-DNA--[protein]-cysteine S-methyltransferase [Vagococcus zengguangii]QCI87250.1 methylated-DNA--[protein]-cysteine S-methyltransferase [Vagococcus zengguangii]
MNVLYYDDLKVKNYQVYLLVSSRGWVAISAFDEPKDAFLSRYAAYDCRLSKQILAPYQRELAEYFEGSRQMFSLPIDLLGEGTAFQLEVWQALQGIPYGHTTSYSQIAQMIRRPNAVRAVGTAIGHNPLRIVIPCHRVLRSDGGMGGYNGGIEMKRTLLALEGVRC